MAVGHIEAIAGSGVPPAPNLMFGPPFSPSDARGEAHARTSSVRFAPLDLSPEHALTVGQTLLTV